MTYNTKYADFNEAADKSDGLVVVGVFLEVWDGNNSSCPLQVFSLSCKALEVTDLKTSLAS